MTVSELITKLQEFDPDLKVYVRDWVEDYRGPILLESLRVWKQYTPNGKRKKDIVCLG